MLTLRAALWAFNALRAFFPLSPQGHFVTSFGRKGMTNNKVIST
jgi:hypothetical protein